MRLFIAFLLATLLLSTAFVAPRGRASADAGPRDQRVAAAAEALRAAAAQDVRTEAGSAAIAAVRGSIAAAREIGGDLGHLSGRVLSGAFATGDLSR